MLISKRRIIHALSYEGILLILIAIGLSVFMQVSVQEAGVLGLIMALISVLWNMVFNHYFEKFERYKHWQRTLKIRVLHAIGFEGGLMLATVPIIAWSLSIGLWQAILLDLGLTMAILVYTFIFQWIYDLLEARYVPAQ